MNNLSPLFPNPSTKITGGLQTSQRNFRCRDFELRYMDCLQAYGTRKGFLKCEDYHSDLMECIDARKTVSRFRMMRFHRQKQRWFGERSKEDYYLKDTLDGSYFGGSR